MSTRTAFDGFAIHAVPFADIQGFRTKAYSKFCALQNAAPQGVTLDWNTYRLSVRHIPALPVSLESPHFVGEPSTPPTSTGIKRAKATKAHTFCTAIEPAGSGSKRRTKIGGA